MYDDSTTVARGSNGGGDGDDRGGGDRGDRGGGDRGVGGRGDGSSRGGGGGVDSGIEAAHKPDVTISVAMIESTSEIGQYLLVRSPGWDASSCSTNGPDC